MYLRLPLIFLAVMVGCANPKEKSNYSSDVFVTGAMRNVMWKGELFGTVDLDTLQPRENLYGLGPLAYLSGELLILDGVAYKSTVLTDTTMLVQEIFSAQAPFFVHAYIPEWREQNLPDSIQSIGQLEAFIESVVDTKNPFAFRLSGQAKHATIHIVNLPEGVAVRSPEEAHQGKINYKLNEVSVEVLGFYSKRHKGIFTHHDSNVHLHLIATDKKSMGHVDTLVPGSMKIYFPAGAEFVNQ